MMTFRSSEVQMADLLEAARGLREFEVKQQPTEAVTAVQTKKFIVGSIDDKGMMSVAPRPVFHHIEPDAVKERTRLAKATPGKMYVVLQLRSAEITPVATTVVYQ